MLKTEDSRIAVIILLTLLLQPISYYFAKEYFVMMGMIALGLVIILVIGAAMVYNKLKKRREEGDRQDERSAQCSLRATRNGFVMCIVLAALFEVASATGTGMTSFTMLSWIWQWGMGAYMLSYLYYVRVV